MNWRLRISLLAVVSAVGVAVVYLPQPLQTLQAAEFGIGTGLSAAPQIASQVGYAIGILTLLPLADRLPPRAQVAVQLSVTSFLLALSAVAPTFALTCVLALLTGVATTIAPILIATSVHAVPRASRVVVTAVLGGSFLVGIFFSRSVAGLMAQEWGWRTVSFAFAALAALCIPLVLVTVERPDRANPTTYGAILASLPGMVTRNPALLVNTLIHSCGFGAFIMVWSTLTVYAVHGPLALSVGEAGLLGLAGMAAGGMLIALAPWVARIGTRRVLAAALAIEAAGLVAAAAGSAELGILAVALFAISLGQIAVQASTQVRVIGSVGPDQSGRANTVFMTFGFVGGAIFTTLATVLLQIAGFPAVAGAGVALVAAAAALTLIARRRDLV